MANRKKPIHPTAEPLFRLIREGRFTRAQAAEILGCSVQNITNMQSRGIPPNRVSDVASLCGMATDDYRLQAGLIPGAKPTVLASTALQEFNLLPGFLQAYLQRKVSALLVRYNKIPLKLRKRLLPPSDVDQLRLWETEIENLVLRLGAENKPDAPARVKRVKKAVAENSSAS